MLEPVEQADWDAFLVSEQGCASTDLSNDLTELKQRYTVETTTTAQLYVDGQVMGSIPAELVVG